MSESAAHAALVLMSTIALLNISHQQFGLFLWNSEVCVMTLNRARFLPSIIAWVWGVASCESCVILMRARPLIPSQVYINSVNIQRHITNTQCCCWVPASATYYIKVWYLDYLHIYITPAISFPAIELILEQSHLPREHAHVIQVFRRFEPLIHNLVATITLFTVG